MSAASVACAVGLGWSLVDNLALGAARTADYDDAAFLDSVRVLDVDERTWPDVHEGRTIR